MALTQELDVGMNIEKELTEIKMNQLALAVAIIVLLILQFTGG